MATLPGLGAPEWGVAMQQMSKRWSGVPNGPAGFNPRHGVSASSLRRSSPPMIVPKLSWVDSLIEQVAPCPWSATIGITGVTREAPAAARRPLYTPEERRRRDASGWTMVQGVLAPIQFAVFLISLCLVMNYLLSGGGYEVATASVVVKTGVLYLIMVTGSIWEKQIFGRYLFAPAFFWEDVVSMLVLALHTAYIVELVTGSGDGKELMLLALAAYASYAVNATQFVLKLRSARLESTGCLPPKVTGGWAQ